MTKQGAVHKQSICVDWANLIHVKDQWRSHICIVMGKKSRSDVHVRRQRGEISWKKEENVILFDMK